MQPKLSYERARDRSEVETLCPPNNAEHGAKATEHLFGSAPDCFWRYANADGSTAFYVMRWNSPREKIIRPLSWCHINDGDGWQFKAWPNYRPLYNLPNLVASSPHRRIRHGQTGHQPTVIEKLLNHVSGSFAGIVGTYPRHSFADEKRTAMTVWARHLEAIVSGEAASNVRYITKI